MIPHPKKKRVENRKYLDWVKTHSCVVPLCSNQEIDPHHLKTVGSGGSDYMAIPICRKHHLIYQGKNEQLEKNYGINLWKEAFFFFHEFISNGSGNPGRDL